MDHSKTKVAIVGGGPGGLAALKELRDLGFDVTLFERREDVGGIWTWTADRSITTALKETRLCNSKFWVHLSDFPISSEYPLHLSAPEMGFYLRSYAKHFELYKNIQFGKTVTRFEKSKGPRKWQLTFADDLGAAKPFDKVVWATGGFLNPKPVLFEGQDQFAGRVLHSKEVRNMEDFKSQNVMVLGIGNTAGDIAISLVDGADKVYLSHRRGAKIISRTGANGLPDDFMISATISYIMWQIEARSSWLFGALLDSAMARNFKEKWGENKPEWGFVQSPSIGEGLHIVVCNEHLIPLVKEGKITSTKGIKRIVGPNAVETDDGVIIDDLDTIIACTGYYDDMDVLADALTFVDGPEGAAPLPNLYMGIFPPEYADSVAVISNVHLNSPQIPGQELSAMAVAQIWAGNSCLPSRAEMDSWLLTHQDWLKKRIAKAHGLHRGEVPSMEWHRFVHEAAGTGLLDNIGWSWKAWKLWWTDPELYKALAHGPTTAHAFRVFETGKRSAWEGARQAILDTNTEISEIKKAVAVGKIG